MHFVIALEPATRNAGWGVVVPDLPGCFSAGTTIDEAVDNAREAIELHCASLVEDGLDVPLPKPLSLHQSDATFRGWLWAAVDVQIDKFFGPAEKINITVPVGILARIDAFARRHHEPRSAFLVRAAVDVMSRERAMPAGASADAATKRRRRASPRVR